MRVTLHMVSSLDGIIAKPDNSVAWFETTDRYDKGVGAPDHEEVLKSIDCYVMGSRTYEHALELSRTYGWAYGDKPTIVLTGRPLTSEMPNIEFYSGDLDHLLRHRLQPQFQSVWVVGGSAVIKAFLRQNLADEIRLSILPILLGEGLLFFDNIGREQRLHLRDSAAYQNGMVELCYDIVR